VAPDSDPGEEMALRESLEVFGPDFRDAAFVDFAIGNQSLRDQVPQPGCGERIVLVVKSGHQYLANFCEKVPRSFDMR
jgi:hypothetical protein